jgi:hypothetical protein
LIGRAITAIKPTAVGKGETEIVIYKLHNKEFNDLVVFLTFKFL